MKILSHEFGGLGTFRDDARLPIEELGDAQVIAVSGENGTGKTTALELIPGALYLTTPSRGALAALANRRDSFVETHLTAGDEDLIARVMVNGTAKTKTTEAYLIDGRTNEPITDGKVRSFKAELERRLPPASAYLASAFAAQGGEGRFLDLPVAKRKELFAALLGLGHLEALAEAAGEKSREAHVEVATLGGRAEDLATAASRGAVAASFFVEAQEKLRRATEDRELAETRATDARAALDRWREKSATLDEKAASCSREKEEAIRSRDIISGALGARDEAVKRTGMAEVVLALATADLETDLADHRKATAATETWNAKREQLGEAWRTARDEAEAATRRETAIRDDLGRARRDLDKATARCSELDKQIASGEELRATAETRSAAAARAKSLEVELATSRAAESAVAAKRVTVCAEARRALEQAEKDHWNLLDQVRVNLEQAALAHDRAEAAAGDLKDVTCEGVGKYAACPLIKSATEARDTLGDLAQAHAEARATFDATDFEPTRLDDLKEVAEKLESEKPERGDWRLVEEIEFELTEARALLSAGEIAAAKIEALEPARAELAKLGSERVDLLAKIAIGIDAAEGAAQAALEAAKAQEKAKDAGAAHNDTKPPVLDSSALDATRDRESKAKAELAAAQEAGATAAATLVESGDDLDAAVGAVIVATDAEYSALREAEIHRETKPEPADEGAVEALRVEERKAIAHETTARGALETADAAAADLTKVRAELERVTADLDDWRHLQQAFGRQGIQALEIDAAGPEVSELTNLLLHSCYGPRFTVALETTADKTDGKGTKEVFDLRVIDMERGTDGSADQLSGGEQVLVSEALSLAICIYNARRSGIPMEDLFRDECAGALSAVNATRYIAMLRRALDLGGFARVYFVAHQEHLWDLADARLVVADGQIKVAA